MLVLTRKIGQDIDIGDDIKVKILDILKHKYVRVGIDAPKEIKILRHELAEDDDVLSTDAREATRQGTKNGVFEKPEKSV